MDMNVLILCSNFVSSTRPPNFYSHLGVLPLALHVPKYKLQNEGPQG